MSTSLHLSSFRSFSAHFSYRCPLVLRVIPAFLLHLPMTVNSVPLSVCGTLVDPPERPSVLTHHIKTDLVLREPLQIDQDFLFPKRQNRSFHYGYMFRILINGEKIRHNWLTYSKKNYSLYCFCCKLSSHKNLN